MDMAFAHITTGAAEEVAQTRGVRLPKPVGCIRVAARTFPTWS